MSSMDRHGRSSVEAASARTRGPKSLAGHLAASVFFVCLAVWLTFPLVLDPGAYLPGHGPGDNVTFLWNTWWARRALTDPAASFFYSDAIFWPVGTPLTLHTHALLQSCLAAVMRPAAGLATAQNLVLIGGLAANGIATYTLCYHYSRRVLPSLAGGTSFAWSTYITAHLPGHFDLAHAWVLPLFALLLVRFAAHGSRPRAAALGVALAAVAYSAYYYVLYCLALAGLVFFARRLALAFDRRGSPGRLQRVPLVAAGALVVLMIAVVVTGGASFDIGGFRVSVRSTRNLVALTALLLAVAAAARYSVRVSLAVRGPRASASNARLWALAGLCAIVAAAPLLLAAARLIVEGHYASQPVRWRSSPAGIDAATVLLGPPYHLIAGQWISDVYRARSIDLVEQSGWLGILPMLAMLVAARRHRQDPDVRLWLVTAASFLLVSLGPFLRVLGEDTGLPLPFAALRYVPLAGNARMPGRAIVMVQMSAAVLLAIVMARHVRTARAGVTIVFLIAMETLPRPAALYRLPVADAVDAALVRQDRSRAVLELPAGLRDGFGVEGNLDHRALVHQTIHERPLVGGFVARLSPRIRDTYRQQPFLACALRVSGARAPIDCRFSAAEAASLGIGHLVINRDTLPAPERLSRAILERAGFRFVAQDGTRELYAAR